MDYVSLTANIASIILAAVAMWLALYHKAEADRTNKDTRDLLMEIQTDAKSVANIAVPEMKAYGEAMRNYIFTGSSTERRMLTRVLPGATQGQPATVTDESPSSSVIDRLREVSRQIAEGDRYTPQLRNEAVRLLKEVRTTGQHTDPMFGDILEPILDAFTSSDQYRSVKFIDDTFRDVIATHEGMVFSMLAFWSIKMFADDAVAVAAEKRFMAYVLTASDEATRSMAFHPRLVLSHSRGEEARLQELLNEFKEMDELERLDVLDGLDRRADPYKVQRRPDTRTRRMAEKYRAFLADHREVIQGDLEAVDV